VDRLTGDEIAWAAQLACLFEVGIEKPGNVSPRVAFADMRFEDFTASAVAIGPALRDAGTATVGETIARAEGSHRWSGCQKDLDSVWGFRDPTTRLCVGYSLLGRSVKAQREKS